MHIAYAGSINGKIILVTIDMHSKLNVFTSFSNDFCNKMGLSHYLCSLSLDQLKELFRRYSRRDTRNQIFRFYSLIGTEQNTQHNRTSYDLLNHILHIQWRYTKTYVRQPASIINPIRPVPIYRIRWTSNTLPCWSISTKTWGESTTTFSTSEFRGNY